MPAGEEDIRDAIATLIAILVETGSALGFTFVTLASRRERRVGQPINAPKETVGLAQGKRTNLVPKQNEDDLPTHVDARIDKKLTPTPTDHVTRWTLARLDVLNSGRIQAATAYEDFSRWCRGEGIDPLTPQMFGRRFTEVVESMGG
jgi:hypothetical protein